MKWSTLTDVFLGSFECPIPWALYEERGVAKDNSGKIT